MVILFAPILLSRRILAARKTYRKGDSHERTLAISPLLFKNSFWRFAIAYSVYHIPIYPYTPAAYFIRRCTAHIACPLIYRYSTGLDMSRKPGRSAAHFCAIASANPRIFGKSRKCFRQLRIHACSFCSHSSSLFSQYVRATCAIRSG
jgi:hypothetical protein